MARRCGCASDSCSCVIVAGDGMTVAGAGSERNPYVVTSNVVDIETGIDVQINNANVAVDVHRLDFRGSAVSVTPGVDEAVVTVTVPDVTTGVIIPTGTIWMFGSSNPPDGWLLCDGAIYTIATHPELFAVIGTNFGGDGTSNFAVPNMLDRFPVGASATKPIGTAAAKALAVANLPPHTHAITHDHGPKNTNSAGNHTHEIELSNNDGTAGSVRRGTSTVQVGPGPVRSDGAHIHSVNLGNFVGTSGVTGTGTPVDVMPPWRSLAFVIKA